MFFLILTVLLNVLLTVLFKLFPSCKIDTLQAIVVNYWVCVLTGSITLGHWPVTGQTLHSGWLPWAGLLGAGFISVFNLLAFSTRTDGITTTTVANKLSLVIPVLFSWFLYHESIGAWKLAGIVLAVPAVYLSTRVPEAGSGKRQWLWPVLLFAGSGLLDTLVKYVEQAYLTTSQEQATFTIHSFAAAALLGTLLIVVLRLTGRIRLEARNLLAGLVLGVPNYFSIYFFIRMLHSGLLQSSAAIPVNNIGIVLCSALAAMLFFREKATPVRLVGLAVSVLAILLIAAGDLWK